MPALCSYLYSFRVAQWLCSENWKSSWTETDICSLTSNRGLATHPRPLLPTHLFPFVSQITLHLVSPWVVQKEIFSRDFLFIKLCYCLATHHRQECSCFSTHRPACSLPVGTPSAPGQQSYPPSHVAIAHRSTSLAVHRCMWSSCSALTCLPPSLDWLQAQLVFSTQLQIIHGWIVHGPLAVSQDSVPTAFLVLSSDESTNPLLGTMREERGEPLMKG